MRRIQPGSRNGVKHHALQPMATGISAVPDGTRSVLVGVQPHLSKLIREDAVFCTSNSPQNRHPERSASQIYRLTQRLMARSRRTPRALILPMPLGAFQPPGLRPGLHSARPFGTRYVSGLDPGFPVWHSYCGGGAVEGGVGFPSMVFGSMISVRVPSGSKRFA
jgi:hypothetical protein